MVKGLPLPTGIRQAQVIVEAGVAMTLTELDNLPVELVEKIMLYKGIKQVKLSGD